MLSPSHTELQNVTTTETTGGMIIGDFALRLAAGVIPSHDAGSLAEEDLAIVAAAATDAWSNAGLSAQMLDKLTDAEIRIRDLPQNVLGYASPETIWIDSDAAGIGWFVDRTPSKSEEFDELGNAFVGSGADQSVDLLTVIIHEMGHLLKLDHVKHESLMSDLVDVGTRRSLDPHHVDQLFGDSPTAAKQVREQQKLAVVRRRR